MQKEDPVPLGQRLRQKGLITEDQLADALSRQAQTGRPLGEVLLASGLLPDEPTLYRVLAEKHGREFVSLKGRCVDAQVLALVPARVAEFYQVLPLEKTAHVLTLVTCSLEEQVMREAVGLYFPGPVRTVIAAPQELREAIRMHYGVGAGTIEGMVEDRCSSPEEKSDPGSVEEEDLPASISRFVRQLVTEAYQKGVSDIHIEPGEDPAVRVRYRLDGVLTDVRVPPGLGRFREALASRIKVMAGLNIAEKRLPQDGRIKVRVPDAELDVRVSLIPAHAGESIVLRILNSRRLYLISDLGLSPQRRRLLGDLLSRTSGMIVVTGPTGSGKTTTLYACLAALNTPQRKIISIEDPVEYRLPGMVQIQVNPAAGLTFAGGLRFILRHDPDVMMIGEIRDKETAGMAVQTALTGHLVLSTLHTQDAAGGIARLCDMGIEPYLVASALNCLIAQRLVRRLCVHCRKQTETGLLAPVGCRQCHFTGYHGREAVYEFLPVSEQIREMIVGRAPSDRIRQEAVRAGFRPLRADAQAKLEAGTTSREEVYRALEEGSCDAKAA